MTLIILPACSYYQCHIIQFLIPITSSASIIDLYFSNSSFSIGWSQQYLNWKGTMCLHHLEEYAAIELITIAHSHVLKKVIISRKRSKIHFFSIVILYINSSPKITFHASLETPYKSSNFLENLSSLHVLYYNYALLELRILRNVKKLLLNLRNVKKRCRTLRNVKKR